MLSVIDAPAPKGNSEQVIREVAEGVLRLEAQRKSIGEQITELKGRIKGLGIKIKDFNNALRLHKLEGDERAEALQNLRLCFDALDIDPQGDLFAQTTDDVRLN